MMRVIRSRGREGRPKGCLSVPRARARARIMSQTTVSALPRRLLSGVPFPIFSNDNNTMILLSVTDMCSQISHRSRKICLAFLIII